MINRILGLIGWLGGVHEPAALTWVRRPWAFLTEWIAWLAVTHWLLPPALAASLVLVCRRTGRALGVTSQLPEGERHLYPESYLLDSLTVSLGGRAAERLVHGEVSTGASNDLARTTQLATRMVREFGMSDRLGPVGFSDESPQYLGGQQMTSRP